MAVRTIYTCEQCNKEHVETDVAGDNLTVPMKRVSIKVEAVGVSSFDRYHVQSRALSAIWCDGCIAQHNVSNLILKADTPIKQATLDEVVRMIVKDENARSE